MTAGPWRSRWQLLLVCAGVAAGSVALVALFVHVGDAWFPPRAAAAIAAAPIADRFGAAAAEPPANALAVVMLQLLAIVAAAQALAAAARAIGQPPVIGELAAGILLGPSLLGHVWPAGFVFIFPDASMRGLGLIGQIGIVLYMFLVGMELNTAELRRRARSALAISHFSIVTPFALGVLCAPALFGSYAPAGVRFSAFALFMGIAMSITAFPVLARILEERQLAGTPLGTTALAAAAVGDVTAWTLLAFVVALAGSGGGTAWIRTVALIGAFALMMTALVRPVLARALAPGGCPVTRPRAGAAVAVVFASALLTERLGVHALFGAFLAGAVMPADSAFRRDLRGRIEGLTSILLLPVFFAFTGLRTEVGLLNSPAEWLVCAGIVVVATIGKLAGTLAGARFTGVGWHEAFVLGVLMNTRGLMELVALNVGYELGILSPAMFTMLVVMALTTTAMACPLIDAVRAVKAAIGARRPAVEVGSRPT